MDWKLLAWSFEPCVPDKWTSFCWENMVNHQININLLGAVGVSHIKCVSFLCTKHKEHSATGLKINSNEISGDHTT